MVNLSTPLLRGVLTSPRPFTVVLDYDGTRVTCASLRGESLALGLDYLAHKTPQPLLSECVWSFSLDVLSYGFVQVDCTVTSSPRVMLASGVVRALRGEGAQRVVTDLTGGGAGSLEGLDLTTLGSSVVFGGAARLTVTESGAVLTAPRVVANLSYLDLMIEGLGEGGDHATSLLGLHPSSEGPGAGAVLPHGRFKSLGKGLGGGGFRVLYEGNTTPELPFSHHGPSVVLKLSPTRSLIACYGPQGVVLRPIFTVLNLTPCAMDIEVRLHPQTMAQQGLPYSPPSQHAVPPLSPLPLYSPFTDSVRVRLPGSEWSEVALLRGGARDLWVKVEGSGVGLRWQVEGPLQAIITAPVWVLNLTGLPVASLQPGGSHCPTFPGSLSFPLLASDQGSGAFALTLQYGSSSSAGAGGRGAVTRQIAVPEGGTYALATLHPQLPLVLHTDWVKV